MVGYLRSALGGTEDVLVSQPVFAGSQLCIAVSRVSLQGLVDSDTRCELATLIDTVPADESADAARLLMFLMFRAVTCARSLVRPCLSRLELDLIPFVLLCRTG